MMAGTSDLSPVTAFAFKIKALKLKTMRESVMASP